MADSFGTVVTLIASARLIIGIPPMRATDESCGQDFRRSWLLRRCPFRNANRSTPYFPRFEIVVCVGNAGERITILNRFDSSEPGKFDDLAEVDRSAVHAGGKLSAPGYFVQSKRNRL